MAEEALQEELINFMFLRDADGNLSTMDCLRLWFGKSNETDIEIETRFGGHVASALQGDLETLAKDASGCLALMILIDQFPRNIYRHTVRSFAGDNMSRDMVYCGHKWLEVLRPEECIFVPCLIMTHQENIEQQNYGLRFYDELEPHLPTSLHIFRTILEEHQRIIALCGTFPHRDHYYGRKTSAIGKSLMDNPTVRFDLPLCADEATGKVYFGHDPVKLWQSTQHAFDVVDRIDALMNHSARASAAPKDYMTPKRSAEFAELFRTFDKDGSGFLEVDELAAVLESTGHNYSDEQVQEAVDNVTGIKGSVGLTLEQFANLLRINLSSTLEARIKQRYEVFDIDKSGDVTLEEFTACIQGLDALVTSSEAAAMFKNCDGDANGTVSLQEFMEVIEKQVSVAA